MLYIGRTTVAGVITLSLFVCRALKNIGWGEEPWYPIAEFMTQPLVVFVLFLLAGTIILLPFLKGKKALILAPLMVIFVSFFVYAYYMM